MGRVIFICFYNLLKLLKKTAGQIDAFIREELCYEKAHGEMDLLFFGCDYDADRSAGDGAGGRRRGFECRY